MRRKEANTTGTRDSSLVARSRKFFNKYLRVWWKLADLSFQMQLSTPMSSVGYLLGKFVRLAFFFVFIAAIFQHTKSLAGYSMTETVLFFLTFNIIDMGAQFFFRGIYGIRRTIREGDFDFFLIQPLNPLFRLASGTIDFLDLCTFVPVLAMTAVTLVKLPGPLSLGQGVLYVLLCSNGILIALAIHIFVAAVAVRLQEMENTIWFYRDMMSLGRFPADIYQKPLRLVLYSLIPVAVMVSLPVKVTIGALSGIWILYAAAVAGVLLTLSLAAWKSSLKAYSSVSS